MSDQDFFFDEDEAQAPASAKSSGDKADKSPSRSKQAEPSATVAGQSVTVTVAALLAIIGVLIGLIGGVFVARMLPGGAGAPTAATTSAPQLTDQQIQSGELPPNHPNIGQMGGSAAASSTNTTP